MTLRDKPFLSLYTNYFSAYRKEAPDGTLFLSIARLQLKSFRFKTFDKFFPPVQLLWDYKDGRITWETYEKEYKAQVLDTLVPSEIVAELTELAGDNKRVCLLCWEKSEEHCHRRLVMDWLNEYAEELEYRKYYD